MDNNLKGKYLVKNSQDGTYTDIATLFDGARILSVNGLNSIGKALNVYTAQWIASNTEDFYINAQNGQIVRENTDITIVLIVSQKYATNSIDTETQYENVINYLTSTDVWVASRYIDKQVHCVCLNSVEPRSMKLKRGDNSYIIAELKLHMLDKPTNY